MKIGTADKSFSKKRDKDLSFRERDGAGPALALNKRSRGGDAKTDAADFLDEHLNVSWLRPESALCDAIASELIAAHPLISPSMDLGSGNGIFSFITAGGAFAAEYDWYRNVNPAGFWANADIYDNFDLPVRSEWIKRPPPPQRRFDFALDVKRSLLLQAKALGWYRQLLLAQANDSLPFAADTFETVFSNVLCWLRSPEFALAEIRRVLKPSGRAFLCLQDPIFKKYCISYQWKERGSELLRLLNRGRAEGSAWTLSLRELKSICGRIGMRVAEHKYYLCPLTLQTWDIGLRPFSAVLIKMVRKLTEKDRLEFKQEWIETIRPFLLELLDLDRNSRSQGGFQFIVLERI